MVQRGREERDSLFWLRYMYLWECTAATECMYLRRTKHGTREINMRNYCLWGNMGFRCCLRLWWRPRACLYYELWPRITNESASRKEKEQPLWLAALILHLQFRFAFRSFRIRNFQDRKSSRKHLGYSWRFITVPRTNLNYQRIRIEFLRQSPYCRRIYDKMATKSRTYRAISVKRGRNTRKPWWETTVKVRSRWNSASFTFEESKRLRKNRQSEITSATSQKRLGEREK